MDAHGAVKVLLGGTCLEGHRQALHDLGSIRAHPAGSRTNRRHTQHRAQSLPTHSSNLLGIKFKGVLHAPIHTTAVPLLQIQPTLIRANTFLPLPLRTYMWQPTTRSVSACTISFMMVFSSRPDSVYFMGLNFDTYTSIVPLSSVCAASSV